jgi:predicted membrane protein
MKTKLIIAIAFLLSVNLLHAQEFKLAKSSGRLELKELNHVTIEGYSGNEIIFSSHNNDRQDDERAKGLRAVSSLGLEDNSGIGLSVVEKGTTIEVQQLKKMEDDEFTIKVPKGIIVSVVHNSPYGGDVEFKNLENEIEVSMLHNDVILNNVTGPLTVKTVHGDVDIAFTTGMKSPISIATIHGHVDVTVPADTKANLKMGTVYGEIFVDPSFKIEIDKSGNMVRYSDNITGKINGGGLDIALSATHSNIYLRKK